VIDIDQVHIGEVHGTIEVQEELEAKISQEWHAAPCQLRSRGEGD
jgi:hypothetical protein